MKSLRTLVSDLIGQVLELAPGDTEHQIAWVEQNLRDQGDARIRGMLSWAPAMLRWLREVEGFKMQDEQFNADDERTVLDAALEDLATLDASERQEVLAKLRTLAADPGHPSHGWAARLYAELMKGDASESG